MRFPSREQAARMGQEVLTILRNGGYHAPSGRLVDLHELIDACRTGTVEVPPEAPIPAVPARDVQTRITVENRTVLEVGRRDDKKH